MRSPVAVVATFAVLLLTGTSAADAATKPPAPTPFDISSVTRTVTRSSTAPTTPVAPVLALQGRGFGHGRGMSQWGARGAATRGLTAPQILDFYYPGTSSASVGNPQVRVRLTSMGSSPTVVAGEAGLTLTDGTCTAALAPATATSWRVSRTSTGSWAVEGHYTNASGTTGWWRLSTTCTGFASAKELTFVGDGSLAASVLTLRTPSGNRQYRGGLRAAPVVLRSSGTSTSTTATVNVVAMDSYLRSVVPAEMPASWALEAVKAQSVAARSYTAARLGSADGFDICDTTTCQVYPGLTSSNPEHPNSDAAVAATTGQVRTYGSTIAVTEFGSTNGGQVVGSSLPYQLAKADPYDGVHADAPDTWSYATMPASAVEKAWPAIGTFRSMSVTRDGRGTWAGGRATSVVLTGSGGSATVGAETFRSRLGLRSTWFTPVGSSVGTDFARNGFSDLIARDAGGTLWNYPSNGRGGWLPRTTIATGWAAAPEILAPGDFSGDGIPDLLTRSAAGDLILRRGTGTGTLGAGSVVAQGWQGFTAVLAPGDLDGDGHLDLLARDSAGTLWLYRSNGAGALLARVSKGGGWQAFRELEAVGDLDRDGGADLAGITTTGALQLLRFSPTGAYLGARHLGWGFTGFTGLTGMGDVNGDRFLDVMARDTEGRLWAYLGDGAGAVPARMHVATGWQSMTFGS